ncbi:hypothetical protein H4R21_000504 [Coemansia helicoidea]|uniref:Uncharacterized protein n=1 Tax=Coemansia helicoidea TaxID=1286919 RepID=A0ACC1LFX4_9FUNG|nr:hypothetical protein H4R21_000504 [Coemansia helicoidea]
MRLSLRRWLLVLVAVIAILSLAYVAHRTQDELLYGKSVVVQTLRDNEAIRSQFTGSKLEVGATQLVAPERILMYTPVGCTFDKLACQYRSGCAQTTKVCDRNSTHTGCDIRLDGDYSYNQLPAKNRAIVEHMCRERLADKYDLFVKVDDDVLFRPDQVRAVLGHARLAPRMLAGFLRRTNEGAVWATGAMYIYSADVLRALCASAALRDQLAVGGFEDVRFGMALHEIGGLSYYNIDDALSIHHLQYRSSRVFIQFLQYGKCSM